MHYYAHHISDFNNATRHLDRNERSIYVELLWLYYDSEEPLPDDLDKLAKLILARGEQYAIKEILGEFFELTEGGWINPRCDAEIDKYRAKAERAKKANKIRWGSEKDLKSDLKSDTDQIPTNNQEPITNNHKPITKKKKTSIPKDFGISDRVKQWAAKKGHNHLDQHLENFKLQCAAKNYQYVDWDSAFMNAIRNNWAKIGDLFDKQEPRSRLREL